MSVAYYSRAATEEFWSEHWRGSSLGAALRVALASPLTDLIVAALPPPGARVLEAGCGLGQYVILLRERGYRATGADWSGESLRACRREAPGAPLSVMNLRQLGFRRAAFVAYLSLGVVEHDPEGPDAILGEAYRVLEPGGVLIVSVPYVNAVRSLAGPWIRYQNDRIRRAGGQFYQFTFSRGEIRAAIERNGFTLLRATPYDPARILRHAWSRMARAARVGARPRKGRGDDVRSTLGGAVRPLVRRSAALGAARRLLYTRLALFAFGHMILCVAVKRR